MAPPKPPPRVRIATVEHTMKVGLANCLGSGETCEKRGGKEGLVGSSFVFFFPQKNVVVKFLVVFVLSWFLAAPREERFFLLIYSFH